MTHKTNKNRALSKLSEQELEILSGLQSGKGLQEIFAPMMKRVMEVALEGEIEEYLDDKRGSNRRNGKSAKQIRSSFGQFELETPRDRNSEFEPNLIAKRQTKLPEDLEVKILNLYKSGMSYSDIRSNMEDIYQVNVSDGAINRITDQIIVELDEWKERVLESVYPILYLDAIHFKVREDGKVASKAVYSLLAINQQGKKEILGLYINDAEGANFWSSVLVDLKQRGVKDILIACIDGLKGFPEAIHTHFPETEIQLCIVHQIRHSMRYVASKHQREFSSDLKQVYQSSSLDLAETKLLKLDEKWGKKYPIAIKSWQNNWENLSAFFKYDSHIRRLIYTTNPVEALHRQVRKYTKSKGSFTSENALLKLVFSAYNKITTKWTQPVHNWALIISQLELNFPQRLCLN